MNIREQVKELRELAGILHDGKRYVDQEIVCQAADTIETLSAKLKDVERSEDCGGWILCKDVLPEEGQEVLVSDGKSVYLVEYDGDLDCPFGDIDNIRKWQPCPQP